MSHLDQYRQDLAWELTIDKNLNHEAITQRLDTLVELAKNAGKMELNAKHDIKIDTFNPFNKIVMITEAQYIKAKKIVDTYESKVKQIDIDKFLIFYLPLTARAYNLLKANGFDRDSTINDLSKLSKKSLFKFNNAGTKTINELEQILSAFDLSFKP